MTHAKRAKIGVAVAVVGSVPLILYVMLGPRDGNPVGLGLLMALSWLVGAVLTAWGVIGLVVARFVGGGK
jgi:hypothetical protein